MKRLELSEVVLTLKAAGIVDIAGFDWFEKPDPRGIERAESLLADLGALAGPAGRHHGHRPAHAALPRPPALRPDVPRGAGARLRAPGRDDGRPDPGPQFPAQGRVPPGRGGARGAFGEEHESDFFLLMRAWRYAESNGYSVDACRRLGIHAQAARQVGPLFGQFLEIAQAEGLDATERRVEGTEVCKCVLAGFPDHLARRLDSSTLRCELVHGRRGLLARESAIAKSPLIVAAEITEVGGRSGEVSVILNIATAVEESWLKELFPGELTDTREVAYDTGAKRVVARRERRFRDLVLESRSGSDDVPSNEAAALLAREVAAGRITIDAGTSRSSSGSPGSTAWPSGFRSTR